MRKLLTLLAAGALVLLTVPASQAQPLPVSPGHENPESVLWDAATNSWYVTSLGGYALGVADPAQNGFISKVSPDGGIAERWVGGLRSPKGMRAFAGRLYVADFGVGGGEVVVVEMASGEITQRIFVPGAVFLNDVAIDPRNGDVYVSDMMRDEIVRIRHGGEVVESFLLSPELEGPNGLLYDDGALLVAGVGPGLNPNTFQTEAPGRVLRVDLATRTVTAVSERLGGLDGIERDGEDVLVSDFFGGRVLRVTPDGAATVVVQLAPTTADIGWRPDHRVLGVPIMAANVAVFLEQS